MNWALKDCLRGDMIRVNLSGLYHYGIYVSDDEVIQFGYPPILRDKDKNNIVVVATNIATFSCAKIIEVAVPSRLEIKKKFKPEVVVENARKRIGEGGYNIIHNNCEHFAYECYLGAHYSSQEEEARERWNKIGYINVYFKEVNKELESEKLPSKLLEEVFAKDNGNNPKEATFAALFALKFALQHSLSKRFIDLDIKYKKGHFLLQDCYVSLGISNGLICIVTSNHQIGASLSNFKSWTKKNKFVDLTKLIDDISYKDENIKLSHEKYLEYVTKKNSIKDYLRKDKLPLNRINTSKYALSFFKVMTDYYLSICGDNPESIRFFNIDENNEVTLFKGKVEE